MSMRKTEIRKHFKEKRQALTDRDVNVYQENLFHTKMMLKDFELDNYIFGIGAAELDAGEQKLIARKVKREMREIFYGRNLPDFE